MSYVSNRVNCVFEGHGLLKKTRSTVRLARNKAIVDHIFSYNERSGNQLKAQCSTTM